jgi:signal transduction histidine kinase
MTLRLKTLLIILVTLIVLLGLLFAASQLILLRSFEELEQERAQENTQRVLNAFLDRQLDLTRNASSWSIWDSAYSYAESPDEQFETDLRGEAIASNNRTLFLVGDTKGEAIDAFGQNSATGELTEAPEASLALLKAPSVIQLAAYTPDAPVVGLVENITGVVKIDGRPTLIGITPILPTADGDEVGQNSRGVIVFGRLADEAFIQQFSEDLKLSVTLTPYADMQLEDDVRVALLSDDTGESLTVKALDSDTIAGYILIRDINNDPILVMSVDLPRSIYQEGQQAVQFFLFALLGIGLLFLVTSLLLLEWMVLSRVSTLAEDVSGVGGNVATRIKVQGADELSSLGQDINKMLDSIEGAQKSLIEKDRRLSEQNLELAKANQDLNIARQKAEESARLKSEFLASMSHELRTPLNAIIGYSQLMMRGAGGELVEKHRRNVERIFTNGEHLLRLINDVLDLAKIEAGRMELSPTVVNVRNFADEAHRQTQGLAEQKRLRFEFEVENGLPALLVYDRDRLKQVVLNLVSNAIKFTETGSVRVEYKKSSMTEWAISVTDTGIGIPAHAQEYIFDEFRQVDGSTTRKHGGTGLGLAIVRNLVATMGGQISLKSQVGQGSTFTVVMPLKVAPVGAEEGKPA